MFRSSAAALSLFVLTAPLLAAEPGGTVSGTIDGKEVELSVFAMQSDYGNAHISLYVLGADLQERGLGSLSLGAEWIGDIEAGFSFADVSIRIPDTDPSRIYHGEIDDGLSLTLTGASITNGMMEVAGQVRGDLTRMDAMGLKNPDPDDTLSIDLSFDAILE